jgi:hypothetical protein
MVKLALRYVCCSTIAVGMVACCETDVETTVQSGRDTALQSSVLEPDSNPHLVMLPIRAFQQTTSYTCGPAALLTLLRHYEKDGDEMTIADEARCTPDKGTDPDNMVAWLEAHGFQVTWGEHGSLDLLRGNLERGVPTLVEWIDYGGHWVVVVGYDTRGTDTPWDDVIHFADPADDHDDERDGLTSFNALRFDAMWFDAFLFDRPMFKVFITATPKEAANSL